MCNVRDLAIKLIKEAEGFSATIYKCPAGFKTIGYGRNIEGLTHDQLAKLIKGYKEGSEVRVTQDQASEWVAEEVDKITRCLDKTKYFPSQPLNVKAVCIDMVYNLGLAGFNKFVKFQAALSKHDYEKACEELKNSRWFNQVKTRAHRNVALILGNTI